MLPILYPPGLEKNVPILSLLSRHLLSLLLEASAQLFGRQLMKNRDKSLGALSLSCLKGTPNSGWSFSVPAHCPSFPPRLQTALPRKLSANRFQCSFMHASLTFPWLKQCKWFIQDPTSRDTGSWIGGPSLKSQPRSTHRMLGRLYQINIKNSAPGSILYKMSYIVINYVTVWLWNGIS